MQPATGQALPQVAMPARVISANGVAVARDVPFAILFYLTTAGLVAAAALLPMPAMEGEEVRMQDTGGGEEGAPDAMTGLAVPMAAAAVGTVFGTSICAGAWLLIMRACARNLVVAALVIPVVLSGALTLWCAGRLAMGGFDSPDGPGGVLLLGGAGLLFTLVNLCWLRGMWHKVPATSLALSLSSHVVFRLPLTMVVAAKVVVLQVAWASLTLLAAVKLLGALVATGAGAEGGGGGWGEGEGGEGEGVGGLCTAAALGLLVALYWGLMVLANVGYVTTCGSVASWYFERARPSALLLLLPVVVDISPRADVVVRVDLRGVVPRRDRPSDRHAAQVHRAQRARGRQPRLRPVALLPLHLRRHRGPCLHVQRVGARLRGDVRTASDGGARGVAARPRAGLAAILSASSPTPSSVTASPSPPSAACRRRRRRRRCAKAAAPTACSMARAALGVGPRCPSATCLSPVRAAMRTVLVCLPRRSTRGTVSRPMARSPSTRSRPVAPGAPPTAVGVPVGAAAARQAGYQQLVAPCATAEPRSAS